MAEPRIIRGDAVEHLERAPGVAVSAYVTREAGASEISSGITAFAPGCANTAHYHNAEESVIVIEGEGILMLNGVEHPVKAGDAAFITPGAHHRLTNTGATPFRIAWAYATVEVTRTLVEE